MDVVSIVFLTGFGIAQVVSLVWFVKKTNLIDHIKELNETGNAVEVGNMLEVSQMYIDLGRTLL